MSTHAQDIMTKKLFTVRLDDSVRLAYEIMKERRIRHLPVRDDAGAIVGILSERDLERAMRPTTALELDLGRDVEFDENHACKDFMTWPVRTVGLDTSIEEVATRMIREKVSSMVVTRRGNAVGIVTSEDLLQLLVRLLREDAANAMIPLERVLSDIEINGVSQWA